MGRGHAQRGCPHAQSEEVHVPQAETLHRVVMVN